MNEEILAIALEKYCSPHGKANPETYAYIDGIEMMKDFILWADDNWYREGKKDSWTDMIGEPEAKHYTTIELLTKYLNDDSKRKSR